MNNDYAKIDAYYVQSRIQKNYLKCGIIVGLTRNKYVTMKVY